MPPEKKYSDSNHADDDLDDFSAIPYDASSNEIPLAKAGKQCVLSDTMLSDAIAEADIIVRPDYARFDTHQCILEESDGIQASQMSCDEQLAEIRLIEANHKDSPDIIEPSSCSAIQRLHAMRFVLKNGRGSRKYMIDHRSGATDSTDDSVLRLRAFFVPKIMCSKEGNNS